MLAGLFMLVWLSALVSANVSLYRGEGEDAVIERGGDASQGCSWVFTAESQDSSQGSPWLDQGTTCCYPKSGCSSNNDPICREDGSFRLESGNGKCKLHLLPVRLTDVGLYTTTFIASGRSLQTTLEMRMKMPSKQGRCGPDFPFPNGQPGRCDARVSQDKVGPCCSGEGWCGSSPLHCECDNCVNYRRVLPTGRCGRDHPDPDGRPGRCDHRANQDKVGPCCSASGWCGASEAHCNCDGCTDYRLTVWTQWSPWSGCSRTCGAGSATRTRSCSSPGGQGSSCPGQGTETRQCNDGNCPVDGSWSSWSTWSQCSLSCGGGFRTRDRYCSSPRAGGKPCLGDRKSVV